MQIIEPMPGTPEIPETPYVFKQSPYSSHGLILSKFPENGRGLRVLDVGCGPGYLASALAQRGYDVLAIDSQLPAQLPSRNGLKFVEADLDTGLSDAGRFDYVLCADILEHVKSPGKLLSEVGNLLGNQGKLIASLPNSGHAYFRLNILMGRFPQHDRGLFDRTHLHFYTWTGWNRLFEASGLMIEDVATTAVPIGLAFPRWENTLPLKVCEFASHLSARLWKTLFAYQFVIVSKVRWNGARS